MTARRLWQAGLLFLLSLLTVLNFNTVLMAGEMAVNPASEKRIGGGYAATGQIEGTGYSGRLFDATNGLPTSDANCILSASDGYIWIGSYAGIIKYDGRDFERLDSTKGMTSGRALFEDSKKRIWVGTNDNGVVVIDGSETRTYTESDGLLSSSIRAFAEDPEGNIYIGSTSGIAVVDPQGRLSLFEDYRLENMIVEKLIRAFDGRIYGCTENGDIFSIFEGKIEGFVGANVIGLDRILSIYPDPEISGKVYIGIAAGKVYYGSFGVGKKNLKSIPVDPADEINYITEACGRIWICSEEVLGYLDKDQVYHVVGDLPVNNSMVMLTEDYQGNIWVASSRQGVMKIVASNFQNITKTAGFGEEVVNSTCIRNGLIYIGTDKGLQIMDTKYHVIKNELTSMLNGIRIRCIMKDSSDVIWISTYTHDVGLISYQPDGRIKSHIKALGMVDNMIRCTTEAEDGSILAGTNGGLSIIKDGLVRKSVGETDVVKNTVFLTVEDGGNGDVFAGTDGDGIYVINDEGERRIGKDDGLTSDVVLRIKKDEQRGLHWIITSNSIEYLKDGKITQVTTFPYNNNFDIYYGQNDDVWILSSYGIFVVKGQQLLDDNITDYKVFTVANGLTGTVTVNSFSSMDDEGNLYVCCANGVSRVNINSVIDSNLSVRLGIRSIFCGEEEIKADKEGKYTIPPGEGRIEITPAVLNYTMTNPVVHAFLEGTDDEGITVTQDDLTTLEYTGLHYGDHVLHVQLLDEKGESIRQDETFLITKTPYLYELLVVRILLVAFIALLVGFIVWRVMNSTIIHRQYEEIKAARDEAERANMAKSKFLASMSHEIRTPINTIMGMDEMILREDGAAVPKEYYNSVTNYAVDIKNASESLLGLINNLLDMSKLDSGKMHVVEREYDVKEMLRLIVTMIRVRSRDKDLTFDLDIDESIPSKLYGDSEKIRQILLNLLSNAVKYTENGGFTLKAFMEERNNDRCRLKFSVKDTGIGIRPEDMDKLFEAYERLDEKKNSEVQGTGLGLDISKQYAEMMGGTLICKSVCGVGSDFILTIEQKILDKSPIGVFSEHDDRSDRGTYVPRFVAPDAEILVVDDNPMNLTVIKGLLKATQMFITTAESGQECLERIRYGEYDVVLLDHMMPGMDGIETLERIREDHPDLPVYALTANITAGEDFYISKGFNGYLSKPIDSYTLEQTILKHLPEEIVLKADESDAVTVMEDLPEDMAWLREVEGVSVDEGIKNSGGVDTYLYSVRTFYDSIDSNLELIQNAYKDKDFKLYTVKVHALKSSARIIGAGELSSLCQKLEDAGDINDTGYIDNNNPKLVSDYSAFKEKLQRLDDKKQDDDKEMIPEDELKEAYQALKEVIPQMDYDSVEMIISQLKEYSLPDKDALIMDDIEKMLRKFDWDGMEVIVNERF